MSHDARIRTTGAMTASRDSTLWTEDTTLANVVTRRPPHKSADVANHEGPQKGAASSLNHWGAPRRPTRFVALTAGTSTMARSPSPDNSPEVDFGAFRRDKSRTAGSASSSSSSRATHLNGFTNAYAQSNSADGLSSARAKSSRQGAPRLGGLGLGGIHTSSSASNTTTKTTDSTRTRSTIPTSSSSTRSSEPVSSPVRPLNIQRKSSSNRKPAPSPTLEDMKAAAPSQRSSSGHATSISSSREGQTEKAFLYPQMDKPTMRTGAFALDRSVPEVLQTSNSSTTSSSSSTQKSSQPLQQLPSPPDSPAEEPIEEFFGRSPPTTPFVKEDEEVKWARRRSIDSDGSSNRSNRFGMVGQMMTGSDGAEAATKASTDEVASDNRTSRHTDSDTMEVLNQREDNDTESTASMASFESAQDDTGGEEIRFGEGDQQSSPSQQQQNVHDGSPMSRYDEDRTVTSPEAHNMLTVPGLTTAHATDSSDSAVSGSGPRTPPPPDSSKFGHYSVDDDDDEFSKVQSREPASIEALLSSRARAGYSIPVHTVDGVNGYYSDDDEENHRQQQAQSENVGETQEQQQQRQDFLSTDPVETGLLTSSSTLPPPVGMSRSSSGRSIGSRSRSPKPPRPSRARRPPGSFSSQSNPGSPQLSVGEFSGTEDNGVFSSSDERDPLASDAHRTARQAVTSVQPEPLSYKPREPTKPPTIRQDSSNGVAQGGDTITPTLSRHTSFNNPSSSSVAAGPTATSPLTTPTANSTNSYEGLGLRLPSTLRGSGSTKRNSRGSGSLTSPLASPTSIPTLNPLIIPSSASFNNNVSVKKDNQHVESPTSTLSSSSTGQASSNVSNAPHVPSMVAHVTQLRRMSMDREEDTETIHQNNDNNKDNKISTDSFSPVKQTRPNLQRVVEVDSQTNFKQNQQISINDSIDEVSETLTQTKLEGVSDSETALNVSTDATKALGDIGTDGSTQNSISTTNENDIQIGVKNSERRGSNASNASGGVTDIGAAAVGAIVTGSMAVGWAAWRGLSAAASYGLGRTVSGNVDKDNSTHESDRDQGLQVAKQQDTSEAGYDSTPNLGGLPGRFESVTETNKIETDDEDEDDENTFQDANDDQEKAFGLESSPQPVSTEWGDVEFAAPKGFLEAFEKAMEEIGPEDIAANQADEEEAAAAAHASAMRLHQEALKAFPRKPIRKRDGIVPERPQSPRNDEEDEDDEDYDDEERGEAYEELMDLVSPMFDSKNAKDAKYLIPPGLSGGGGGGGSQALSRSFSQQSSASSSSLKSAPKSPNPALKASLSPTIPKSRSLFGFGGGGGSKEGGTGHGRRASIDSDRSSPSYTKSVASVTSDNDDPTSITSGGSKLARKKKTRSLFGIRKSSSPSDMPSIESQIVDTTYVSYSSGRAAQKRKSSLSSNSTTTTTTTTTTNDPTSPMSTSSGRLPSPENLHSPSTASSSRPRRSSLRKVSRYDRDNFQPPPPSKLYRVRFGNASRGIGLRSVAEDEAERAGGEEYAIRWVGVGRGNRYGNLLIQTDETNDEKYAVQVNDIKKRWRSRNTKGYNRDWTTVRID
ncbi:hypothetical protein OIO90_000237 [Microbotryomycetes sp. JL221]|nr:hypothetical protein OIO90_000237 [Microbotryomycetes sp. JL221]